MKNYRQPGQKINVTNGTGSTITSGSVLFVGTLPVIAEADIADQDWGVCIAEGVVELDKTAPLVITQGDKLYWNTSTKKVTKTVTDKLIGMAWENAASAATKAYCKLLDVAASTEAASFDVAANVPAEATADGSDAATTQALANALKVTVNDILTALKAAGIMAADA